MSHRKYTDQFTPLTEKPAFREELTRAQEAAAARAEEIETCPNCEGRQLYTIEDPNNPTKSILVECDCAANERAKNRITRSLGHSGMEDYLGDTFQAKPALPGQTHNWDRGFQWSQEPAGILWIYGEYYTGKSCLAHCIANEWIAQGWPVLYRFLPELLEQLRDSYDKRNQQTFQELFATVNDAELLILDDWGKEGSSEWTKSTRELIAYKRLESRRATIVTTNWTLEDVRVKQPRLYPRLNDPDVARLMHFHNKPVGQP